MLFRYKIYKRYDYICSSFTTIHYEVKIQKYNKNNVFFKWTTYKDTTLKNIVELLGSEYCFSDWDNALQEIYETITQYGSVDKMITEYIRKFIIRDIEHNNMMNNIEISIDELVLMNDWKTIEIKENE